MATNTINPYPIVGTQLTNGLAALSANLTNSSTVANLVTQVYNYVQSVYYPSAGSVPQDIQTEVQAAIYHIINGYNNSILRTSASCLTTKQAYFVELMLGLKLTNTTPINYLSSWILDIEDNITKAELSTDEQIPLLLGTQMASTMNTYWTSQVASPNTLWTSIFSSNTAENYANIPHWTAACIDGAIIGATASPLTGLITPSTDITSVTIISALAGALAIGAGKVMFGWVPRIQPTSVVSAMAGAIPQGTVVGGGMNANRANIPANINMPANPWKK